MFTKTATGWRQSAELSGSPTGSFGTSVAISGANIVVGGSTIAYTGEAYVFTNTAKGWRQTALLTDSQAAPANGFGDSVAVSGTTLAVGAPDQGSSLSGAVYVFTQTAKGWHQTAELEGSDTVANDLFGDPIALWARRL